MKKYLPAFVCGFGAGVLMVVPVAKSLSCCLIIPGAAFLALVLDQKANRLVGDIPINRAVILGTLTGLYAGVFGSFFDLFITFITHNNDLIIAFNDLQKLINEFPINTELKEEVFKILNNVISDIIEYGFSWTYAIIIILNNLIINTLFGLIGGVIGVKILNSRSASVK